MTDCNGCGQCCSPVVLPYSRHEAQMLLPAVRHEMFTEREWRWIMEDLEPIPRRDGLARAPYLTDGKTRLMVDGYGEVVLFSNFYRCRQYDEETGRCLTYDDRPEVCAEFPWYGDPPDPTKAIPPPCSYNADVGQPVAAPTRKTVTPRP